MTYNRKPQEIYKKVAGYVDKAVTISCEQLPRSIRQLYKPRRFSLPYRSIPRPEQWRFLLRAIIHGKDNDVKVVITTIRE
jgi:hypothetical protein